MFDIRNAGKKGFTNVVKHKRCRVNKKIYINFIYFLNEEKWESTNVKKHQKYRVGELELFIIIIRHKNAKWKK